MPAIEKAESLLNLNTNGTCALSLLFFSDGVPSDQREDHRGRCGQLASKFGRRLSVTCIGMADGNESFETLRGIVEEAESFGSVASFGKPSLDADSLSNIISTLASSLTTTKTEMTEINSGRSKAVRMDVTREKKGTPDDLYLTDEWLTYHDEEVGTFWIWDYERNDFVELFDYRCHYCEKDTRIAEGSIMLKAEARMCPHCHGACFCSSQCFMLGGLRHHLGEGHLRSCSEIKKMMMAGDITMRPLPSYSLSVKKTVFGEGAERMVRKLRFLNKNDQFVGIRYVAKDSRFVEDEGYRTRLRFHTNFARTQSIASGLAKIFNKSISDLVKLNPGNVKWANKVKTLPKIYFLEPMVVEMFEKDRREAVCLLIEPFLEGTYEKFNNNMGYVKGQARDAVCELKSDIVGEKPDEKPTRGQGGGVDLSALLGNMHIGGPSNLGAIVEEEEDEESSSDEEEIFGRNNSDNCARNLTSAQALMCKDLDDKHFPQAFSHFSYVHSKRRFMVVDLQGVLETEIGGGKCYKLTDPVIHKHSRSNRSRYRSWKFGKTDRGTKGMKAFFASHECSDVCRLLGLKEGID